MHGARERCDIGPVITRYFLRKWLCPHGNLVVLIRGTFPPWPPLLSLSLSLSLSVFPLSELVAAGVTEEKPWIRGGDHVRTCHGTGTASIGNRG